MSVATSPLRKWRTIPPSFWATASTAAVRPATKSPLTDLHANHSFIIRSCQAWVVAQSIPEVIVTLSSVRVTIIDGTHPEPMTNASAASRE